MKEWFIKYFTMGTANWGQTVKNSLIIGLILGLFLGLVILLNNL